MTTYKEIRGTNIEAVASDPSNPISGQVWYNTTDNVVKGLSNNTGTWASGNNMNTGRRFLGGAGTQTAALGFGGYVGPFSGLTESYNGTNWTEVADLNLARTNTAGTGASNTAALAIGGEAATETPTNKFFTESWNGSSWTEVGDLSSEKKRGAGVGTNTAALAFEQINTELYNGTNWSEVGNMNGNREKLAGAGISTAALGFGGTPFSALTELWNGSSWTEVADLNTGRQDFAGAGIQTAALAFGGENPNASVDANTETWNGTSWTEVGNMNTARYALSGAGTNTAGLAFGGEPTSNATEEFTAGPVTVTFDVS